MTQTPSGHGSAGELRAQLSRVNPPTQVMKPVRNTVRTTLIAFIGLIPIIVELVRGLGLDSIPWVASTLSIVAIITRVMSTPRAEAWLAKYLPRLALNHYLDNVSRETLEEKSFSNSDETR